MKKAMTRVPLTVLGLALGALFAPDGRRAGNPALPAHAVGLHARG